MFKPAAQTLPVIERAAPGTTTPQPDEAARTVGRLFMLLHGYYGAPWLSKFATGELDAEGKDRGVKSARMVWTSSLRKFDPSVIELAAEKCKKAHVKWPPGLPEFEAICEALEPRPNKPAVHELLIGVSGELRSLQSRKVREAAIQKARALVGDRDTAIGGLDALKTLVAEAVGLAGGNEAAKLVELDRELAGRDR
jgi:hypothetical protein